MLATEKIIEKKKKDVFFKSLIKRALRRVKN
jgi:hypothetical protein